MWNIIIRELKINRDIVFLRYPFVPHWVDVCCWVIFILEHQLASLQHGDARRHQASGFSYVLRCASRHGHAVSGKRFDVYVSPGEHWVFIISPVANPIGIWVVDPFS